MSRRTPPLAWLAALAVAGLSGLAILDDLLPPDLARFEDRSKLVVDRGGHLLRAFQSRDDKWRFLTTPADVDPLYLAMLKAYEDRRFDLHPGVDPLAVGRAVIQAASAGHVVSGASTLTMQAARLLEPRPRTLPAKLIEMARAVQLERRLGKQGVLSVYLTLAPFGGVLEGVRIASLRLFGKEPKVLTPAEAALLVALPQAPGQRRPDIDEAAARAGRDRVLDRAAAAGVIGREAAERAKRSSLPTTLAALPFVAPHLAEALVREKGRERIRTTIDGALQRSAEHRLRLALQGLPPGVTAAALIVDHRSAEVVAHIGNADYFDRERAGMIDMTRALRSPGSTLKPLIYGLAFDRLLVQPMTLIADTPWQIGAYRPGNFDGGHAGEVTVAEALTRSLNIPAIKVMERLGPLRFDAALADAGLHLAFESRASLPIALGGVGMRLGDLVRAYVGLAHGGMVPERLVTTDGETTVSRPLIGPEAAADVLAVLAEVPPPAGRIPDIVAAAGRREAVAYKTGTAYGYRDAWSIGVVGDHVIGVWVGRPDGAPCPGCTGLGVAAPILFDLARLMPPGETSLPDAARLRRGAALPPALQHFERRAAAAPGERPALEIRFPVDGTTLELAAGGAVPMRAAGGSGSYRWLVNGVPLDAAAPGGALWRPASGGFHRITVLDDSGRAARAMVRIEQPQ